MYLFCSLLIFLLLLVIPATKVEAQSQQQTQAAESDSQQLLRESVHILGGHRRPVVRWYEPVRVAVVGPVTEALTIEIRSLFNEISLLSGIPYTLIQHDIDNADTYASTLSHTSDYDLSICENSEPLSCANFVIVLSEKAAMNKVAVALPMRPVFQKATSVSNDDLLCFFSPGIARATEIVRSVVYVQSDIDRAMQLTCLQEEVYQSFGLFDDFSDSQYFSFNNDIKEKQITVFDKQLLTSLYDNAFSRGSPALPVAQQLVDYCDTDC